MHGLGEDGVVLCTPCVSAAHLVSDLKTLGTREQNGMLHFLQVLRIYGLPALVPARRNISQGSSSAVQYSAGNAGTYKVTQRGGFLL